MLIRTIGNLLAKLSPHYRRQKQTPDKNKILAEQHSQTGGFLLNSGKPEEALKYYKLSLDLNCTPEAYSFYLQCLLLCPSTTEQTLFDESVKYSQLFLKGIHPDNKYQTNLTANKKLNIGYICHFFHNSVSQSLLQPFLKEHNRERVKVFCYSDTAPGEVTPDVVHIADVWRDTKHISDHDLAEIIRNDRIDVLLELNGHCIINRYGVMARKPAPVQVSYYNLCATSGVSGIDYVLVGDVISLNQFKNCYTESIYYIHGPAGIAKFPDHFPDCSPPPFLKNGYITFGSFGAAHKVNTEVVKLWCDVLKRVPNSRFYMKAAVLKFSQHIDVYKQMFEAEGISPDRITFEGFSEHHQMLECYGKMDIALDTFPCQGGTTTTEALWQGVPVVSQYGERYSMQVAKMILTCIGHPELVANSRAEFIEYAVQLANDPERIVNYRNQLRHDFKKSLLTDARNFAERLENAYEDMWKRYCHQYSEQNELQTQPAI